MPQLTIAQLVASISADTSAFDARITKVEDQLKKTQASAEKAAEGISKSFSGAAKGVDEVAKSAANAQKAADNLAKYEYTVGQKSAQDYASFLRTRLASINGYSTEAKSLYSQLSAAEVKIAREAATAKNKIVKDNATFEKEWNKLLADDAKAIAATKVQAERAVADAKKASIKAAQDASTQLNTINRQNLQATANVARAEYDSGAKSASDYAFFLEQRMAAYELYSSQWKSASAELLAVQKSMAAEAESIEAEKDAAILARAKEIGAERVAVEKEVNAEMTAWNKQYVAGFVAQMDEAALAAEASAKRTKDIRSGTLNAGGTGAAAITAVELGSAVVAQQFDHTLTGEANNTLMTDADIAKMRANVIELGKSTGQNLQDLAVASRWISDFSKSTDTAEGKLNQLTWANKEAVATMSNTGDVARSLAATMHIFGANTNEAAGYIDVLHHASAAGAMTVQQFASDAGPALAIASAMHDKFYDAAAAMSSLTKAGFDSAEAATQIKSLYAHIGEPADKATKQITALDEAFHKLNPKSDISLKFDFSQPGIQLKGIVGLLKDIEAVTGGRADLISKIIPALRGGVGGMSLAQALGTNGNDVDKLRNDLKNLQTSNNGSETDAVFNRMAADGQQQWKKLAVTLETEFIPIGERAMAVFAKWIPYIKEGADVVVSLMEQFQKLPQPVQEAVTALGGLVIVAKLGVDFTRMFGASVTMVSGLRFIIKAISSSDGIVAAFQLAAGGAGTLGEALMACSVGPAAPLIVIAAAVAALVYGLHLLKDANDDAAHSAARLGAAQATAATMGPLSAIAAQRSRNTSESSDIQGAIQGAKNGDAVGYLGFGEYPAVSKLLRDKGYNTSLPGFRSMDELQARNQKLNADASSMTKQMQTLHSQGVRDTINPLLPADPFKGSGVHVVTPGESGFKAVTPEMLAAQAVSDKADAKAQKAAETAARVLESHYESEVRSLEKIISLKTTSSDLDNKHANLAKVLFDVSSKGDLAGISGGRKRNLEALAERADIAEQEKKVNDLIRKMQEKAIVEQQSPLKQEAIASMGGLENWRGLNPTQARSALNTQLSTDRAESEAKNAKRLKDLAFYATLSGDSVKKAAVEAEGGVDKWNLLTKAQRASRVEAERNVQILDMLTQAKQEWDKQLEESATSDVKTASDAAEVQILGIKDKFKIKGSDHSYDKQFAGIRSDAMDKDANNIDTYLDQLEKKSAEVQKIFDNNNKKSIAFNPGAEARAQFDKDNADEIEKIQKLTGTLKQLRQARIDADRVLTGQNATDNYITTLTRDAQNQTANIVSQTNADLVIAGGNYKTSGDKAVAQWENSPEGVKMISVLGSTSDAVVALETALKVNTNVQERIAEGVARRQQITGAVTDGLFSGAMGALSPNPQQKGTYQTQLLQQQQEMEQYRVAEAEFKSKYPNDPNDPYTQRLKDLQKAIDDTNHKLSAMGNNIGSTFKHMFDSMAQSFEQTLAKMAQDYLKSQLLQYITRQVGTGSSFAGGTGGGFLGGVTSVLGSILGAVGGSNGGASASAIPGATAAGIDTAEAIKFGDGGDFKSGTPFWAGERGKPELIVPDYNGSVIPASKISRGAGGGGGTTINQVSNNMTINTPDVRGFHSSRATIMREYNKGMMKGRR